MSIISYQYYLFNYNRINNINNPKNASNKNILRPHTLKEKHTDIAPEVKPSKEDKSTGNKEYRQVAFG